MWGMYDQQWDTAVDYEVNEPVDWNEVSSRYFAANPGVLFVTDGAIKEWHEGR
jgi:hypothetical protein